VSRKPVSSIMLALLLVSMLTLAFNIQPVKASGTIYIRADGSIDPADAPISTFDNITYTLTRNITSDADGIIVERSNIIIDGNGYTLQGTGAEHYKGIDLSGKKNVTIRNVNIRVCWYGIWLSVSSNNSIHGNNIRSNMFSIYLDNSSYSGIFGNSITNNGEGIYLDNSSNHNSISGNNITASNGNGICLNSSSKNSVCRNNLTSNRNGISLKWSSENSIGGNSMVNKNYGVWLMESSNSSIYGNSITYGEYGVGFWNSSDNKFYHNNFVNSTHQINDYSWDNPWIFPSINAWDDGYPSGGNYWSNYTGIDEKSGSNQDLLGSDGIGDTPYIIDSNNQDNYPLIHPYGSVVNLNTSLTYLTIQSAINAPETLNGHTIFVRSGTYYEDIVVNKSLTIFGEIKDTTFVVGSPGSVVFLVESDNVHISGFTMQNGNTGVQPYAQNATINDNIISNSTSQGIQVGGADNTISRNLIVNCGVAILIYGSNHTIEKNILLNNSYWAMQLSYFSNNNKVRLNEITNNHGSGIYVQSSHNNTISENAFINNEEGIRIAYSTGNVIVHNHIINNTRQVFIDSGNVNNTWDDGYPSGGNFWSDYNGTDLFSGPYQNEPESDGIGDTPYVIDADNQDRYPLIHPWTPAPPEFTGTVYIRTDGSIDPPDAPISTVDNVTYTLTGNITSDADGIVIERDNIVVEGIGYTVQGAGSGNGTDLTSRSNITIKNTTIKTFGNGINLQSSSSNNSISRNNITDNGGGIYLDSSSNNSISGNNIKNNRYGIGLYYSSNFNSISGNNITNNGAGVRLFSSSNNRFYHNNVIDNTKQVSSYDSVNFWGVEYPMGGNYWSDYTGVDLFSGPYQNMTGSDGKGDTPYSIDVNNVDHYPLMNPWTPATPGDINRDGEVDMKDVAVAGVAFGSYAGHPRWNSMADENEDGKIDMGDIALVARNFGKTYL